MSNPFRYMRILSFLLLVFLSFGCQKDDSDLVIDKGLQPYYDLFFVEAESRNRFFTDEEKRITMIFSSIASPTTLGQCHFNQDEPNTIEIDRVYWKTSDEMTREFLVFHEMGHCILGRGHQDAVDGSGRCVSMMHSTVGLCEFDYSGDQRKKYLDELFNF